MVEIPTQNRINLNSCLKEIYGSNYESIPQLDNLMKSNNDGQLKSDALPVQEEARLFKNSQFPEILQSLNAKQIFSLKLFVK